MKKYILFLLTVSLLITSCGDKNNSSEFEMNTFQFKYNMDDYLNDIRLMNTNTLVKEDGNTFSRVGNEVNYSFGIEFKGDKLINTSKNLYIYAKLRKDTITSNSSLIVSCVENDSLIYWQPLPIDTLFVSIPNEWTEFNYNGFKLPENITEQTKIAIYFWSIDGDRLDIDDFEVKF